MRRTHTSSKVWQRSQSAHLNCCFEDEGLLLSARRLSWPHQKAFMFDAPQRSIRPTVWISLVRRAYLITIHAAGGLERMAYLSFFAVESSPLACNCRLRKNMSQLLRLSANEMAVCAAVVAMRGISVRDFHPTGWLCAQPLLRRDVSAFETFSQRNG
jgi:hypothetical protein